MASRCAPVTGPADQAWTIEPDGALRCGRQVPRPDRRCHRTGHARAARRLRPHRRAGLAAGRRSDWRAHRQPCRRTVPRRSGRPGQGRDAAEDRALRGRRSGDQLARELALASLSASAGGAGGRRRAAERAADRPGIRQRARTRLPARRPSPPRSPRACARQSSTTSAAARRAARRRAGSACCRRERRPRSRAARQAGTAAGLARSRTPSTPAWPCATKITCS